MIEKLCRLLNLYSGEGKNALLFALLAFCWSIGINLGLKYSDALLLINVGAEALPTIYIISACGMIIPAIFFMLAINKTQSYKIFLTIIVLVIAFYSFIFSCLTAGCEEKWFWYLLRIGSFQLDVVLITSYWTFIDQYHNMQDAKRMYILFSLMVFCGQAATGFIMQLGLIPVTNIFLIIIFFMFLSAVLVLVIHKKIHLIHDQSITDEEREYTSQSKLFSLLKSIATSRYTLFVMLNNFAIFLMWVTAEYNYLSYFDHYFDPLTNMTTQGGAKEAEITLFLGKILVTVSVTNLLIGLFIYSRLVRSFGVTSLLFFSPIVMAIAMGGWILHPMILFPIIAYFVVEGFLEIIDDSNFNLLLNAIPKRLKYRVRILIESFLEPIAMLCSGIFLTIKIIDPVILCFLLALITIVASWFIKRIYHTAVYRNLTENTIHFDRTTTEWLSLESPEDLQENKKKLLTTLSKSCSNEEKLFSINALFSLNDGEEIDQLLLIAKEWDPLLQSQFLDLLTKCPLAKNKKIAEQISSWLPEIECEQVKAKIHYYLAQSELLHPENVIDNLDHKNLLVKGAAIITLQQNNGNIPSRIQSRYTSLANEALHTLLYSKNEEEVCMGIHTLRNSPNMSNYKLLLSFLDHPSRAIRLQAMETLAVITTKNSRSHAKTLIKFLRSSEDCTFRKSCLKALGKLDDPTLIRDIIASSLHFRQSERRFIESLIKKMGHKAIPALLSTLKNSTLPDRCRALSARILGHLSLSDLQRNLNEIITLEIERAYFYFYHHQCIQAEEPSLNLTILVEALQASFHSVIEFILQLLSTAGEIEDSELIIRLFKSQDNKLRSQVVETLEKTCDRQIFKSLRPLIEPIPPSEVINRYLEGKKLVLKLPGLLKKLSSSPSPTDQIVAVTLMKQTNNTEWKNILLSLLSSREEIFRHFAKELIES